MRYIVCVIFFLVLSSIAVAQNPAEILGKIKSEKNDSAKTELYKKIVYHYQFTDVDSAILYVDRGIKEFKESGYRRGVAILIVTLGNIQSLQGKQELAKLQYKEALAIFEEIGYDNGIAQTNNSIGVAEGRSGNLLAATRHFMKALQIFERTNNTQGIVNTYLKLGTVNDISNNADKALNYFNKGLELAIKINSTKDVIGFYNNIGVVYCKRERSDTGLVFFQKALAMADSLDMTETRVLSMMHIGNAYKDLDKPAKSLEYYNRTLALASVEVMPEHHARTLLNIAALKGVTDHEEALRLLSRTGAIVRDIENKELMLEVMGETIHQHKLLGDYKSAFAVLEDSKKLQDSIFNLDKEIEIANLQSVYELDKSKERVKQLVELGERNNAQRALIIFIACILGVSVLALFAAFRRTRRLNRKLVNSESELQRSSAIKDRIFSIIGHDLRWPIANIPMVIELYQDPRTTDAEKAYMLDLLTENSMASLETLDKLLNWGKSQIKGIAIQQKQFRAAQNIQHQVSLIKGIANNKSVTIKDNVPNDTVIFADEDHFNFVIRNLLSNAIKFSHKDSVVTLDADRYKKDGFTVFSVEDTGVGIAMEQKAEIFEAFGSSTLGTNNEGGTSIGLMLCKEFITENGGDIWVESEPGKGATFYFSFKNA